MVVRIKAESDLRPEIKIVMILLLRLDIMNTETSENVWLAWQKVCMSVLSFMKFSVSSSNQYEHCL